MLCYMHNVPYCSYLCQQFSDAFDIYLEILHHVDLHVSEALGRNGPDWCLWNTCSTCFYKLEGEPSLQFSFLCEMDGNNSLKRVDISTRGQAECPDSRSFRMDYWLTRWCNAGPEQCKRMYAMFAESGIFVVACCHGNILLACDMIWSGELAKYPLAMVNKLMYVHGPNIACGLIVGSFHGHAHNRACQLDWHPHYVTGMGWADFEGCERVFASSNALAPGTRHVSSFHHHQAIEQHFAFWDEDKYATLSHYLSNHYREALKIVKDYPAQLKKIQDTNGISDDDFACYLGTEKSYLQGLRKEPPEETLQFEYVEALDLLCQHRTNWYDAQATVNRLRGSIATPETVKAMQKAIRKVSSLAGRIEMTEQHILFIKDQLGLRGAHWNEAWRSTGYQSINLPSKIPPSSGRARTPCCPMSFELSKLNISGTGYKLRTHITKALTRCSEAIQKALSRYNEQAEQMALPQPTLTWKQIVEYSFLGEFDLLRHARNDVHQESWAKPANREATVQYLGLLQAREELARLEVEIPRLCTWMVNEQFEYEDMIKRTDPVNSPLAGELRSRWACRQMVNELHERCLHWIVELPEYRGLRGPDFMIMPDDMQDGLVDDEDRLVGDIEALDSFVDNIED
ncbi:hypothetical protein BJV78DRAFT_1277468 [Lactifluus subvellereus]|nr:hypothetical protein BJV78DRAFT_1277468 [Lactifluus subvellereus]